VSLVCESGSTLSARSNSCVHRGQPAFAGQPEQHHQQGINHNRADDLLRQWKLLDEHVVPHVYPFASNLKEPNCAYRPSQPGKSIGGVSGLR
jgi:hypothetical protein